MDDAAAEPAPNTAEARKAGKHVIRRTAKGTFQKGFSAHPGQDGGRARRELNADTIRMMHAAFRQHGKKLIDKVIKNNPTMLLKMLVLLVPREMQVEHHGGVKAMSDEQIDRAIEAIEDMLAKRDAGAHDGAFIEQTADQRHSVRDAARRRKLGQRVLGIRRPIATGFRHLHKAGAQGQ